MFSAMMYCGNCASSVVGDLSFGYTIYTVVVQYELNDCGIKNPEKALPEARRRSRSISEVLVRA